jgi:hypothetical protein
VKAPDLNGCFGKEGELAYVELIDRNERAISFPKFTGASLLWQPVSGMPEFASSGLSSIELA